MQRLLITIVASLMSLISVLAQESQDSLVVLVSSKSAQMVDVEGASYRKVVGPARFLHNNTYLLCDTAYWNVETRIIDAWGNVSLLQEETVLTSDKLTYLIDEDLAQFRGSVVKLIDKDHNTLKTRHLDYNTKDSLAIFKNGASMRDKDGQIIESISGTYDSKVKKFTFTENVNMFTDSIFVKTNDLVYESDLNLATFGSATDVWQKKNMLSSNRGWYDRGRELFFFADAVHVMSEDQEGWCDTLYFHRNTSDLEMLGNAQVTDTTRNVYALAGRIEYIDTLSKVTLTRDPAVISQMEEVNGTKDTVYLGADKLVYMTIPMFKVDSVAVEAAKKRLKDLDVDPVGEYRKKAAAEAAKAAATAMENDPNMMAKKAAEERRKAEEKAKAAAAKAEEEKMAEQAMEEQTMSNDSLADSAILTDSSMLADSLAVSDSLAVGDSLMVTDTIAPLPPVDSTGIGFLEAINNVRIFKKSMQVRCDSLVYSDLDSLARLFKTPLIWQDKVRQYTADSVSLIVSDGAMEKASLMSNAFITIQQDDIHYNQIKGTEMLAFFDGDGSLSRFDVLGGASALFYLEENGVYATVNKTDSKMLSASFRNGEIQKIYYYDQPKNDGYPKAQMTSDDRSLKGFSWCPDRRPADRHAVTSLSLRPSQRSRYESRPHAKFKQTDIYFPGYISDIHRQIEVRDSLRKVRAVERRIAEKEARRKALQDSIDFANSLLKADSLFKADSIAKEDSIRLATRVDSLAAADSLKYVKDSLAVTDSVTVEKVLSPQEIKAAEKAAKKAEQARKKAQAKAAREAAKKKRQEAREKRWAELDQRDADKLKIKEEKLKAKERERKRKSIEAAAREAEKDAKALDAYIEKYRKQKERKSKK